MSHVSDKLELLFKAYSTPETEAAPSAGNNADNSVAAAESSQPSLYDVSVYLFTLFFYLSDLVYFVLTQSISLHFVGLLQLSQEHCEW